MIFLSFFDAEFVEVAEDHRVGKWIWWQQVVEKVRYMLTWPGRSPPSLLVPWLAAAARVALGAAAAAPQSEH